MFRYGLQRATMLVPIRLGWMILAARDR